jgi:hypothetical protein
VSNWESRFLFKLKKDLIFILGARKEEKSLMTIHNFVYKAVDMHFKESEFYADFKNANLLNFKHTSGSYWSSNFEGTRTGISPYVDLPYFFNDNIFQFLKLLPFGAGLTL